MSEPTINIFSVFHKVYPVPACDFITPIQVNRQQTNIETGFITDDTGDNISEKNEKFCEYTALYWVWKNMDRFPASHFGLSHYRRYFIAPDKTPFNAIKSIFGSGKNNRGVTMPLNDHALSLAGSEKARQAMSNLLEKGYTIVPNKESFAMKKRMVLSVKNQFIFNHLREDWMVMEEAMRKVHPTYAKSLDYFDKHTGMRPYNMFVGSRQFLDDYCNWVFPLLFEIERNLPVSPYPYQRRAIGFLGERLFNFYIDQNNIKLAVMPVIFFE
jgi:hypothetical protein